MAEGSAAPIGSPAALMVNPWAVWWITGLAGCLTRVVEVVIAAGREADAGLFARSPVGDGWHALLVDKDPAAEDAGIDPARLQRQWMVAPVHEVVAGEVAPAVPFFSLHNVHQVIAPFPVQGGIGVEWAQTPSGATL